MTSGVLTRHNGGRSAPDALIDPRLAARRLEVARGRGRRRRRRLGAGLGLVALAGGAYGVTRTSLLDVDRVDVHGVDGPAATLVADLVAVEPGTALLDVDTGAVEQRVASLPWVSDVAAERQWPGTLQVRVTTRIPVAVDPDGVAVDADGRVLGADVPELSAGASSELPRLELGLGRPGSVVDERGRLLVEVVAAVPPSLAGEVASGRVVGSDVVLTLVDGITVRIGDTSRLTAKFVAVEALLDQAGRATIESLDVRVPSSPSLVPVPGADRETGSSLTGEPGAGA